MLITIQKINKYFRHCFDNAKTFENALKTSDIDSEISDIISKKIPEELLNILGDKKFIVNGSVGKGLATKTPWIAILDKDITTSTRKGVYIVYLFSSDYRRVYLTLNQGTTVPGQFGPRLGKKEVANNSKRIRELLNINDVALKTDGKADIADERYKEGSIFYTLWDVNNEEQGEKLLNHYLEIYKKYKELAMAEKTGKVTVVRQNKEFSIEPKYIPYSSALRTKPFMLLAGISGTGKSRIVRELAKACWKEGDEEFGKNHPRNFCMVQVKPNWHDSSELIGYVSRINGEKYVVGPFLRFLAKAINDTDTPYFLCLDEMNLAPVEQYFAEYLSVIESRKLNADGSITTDPIIPYENTDAYGTLIDQLFADEADRKAYKSETDGKRLTIPQNLFVVGTVNMDETTFSFSRKVLDRAMTLEMNEVDLHGGLIDEGSEIGYISNCIIGTAAEGKDVYADNKELCNQVLAYLEKVNAVLEGTPFKIAYRTRNEFLLYAVNRQLLDKDSQLWQTLDEMTSMKILSRIEGDSERTKSVLDGLKGLVEEEICKAIPEPEEGMEKPKSITDAKIEEMLGKLKLSGYTSYWA
jgi:hypothetical protein